MSGPLLTAAGILVAASGGGAGVCVAVAGATL
jgi:hypothetical protein